MTFETPTYIGGAKTLFITKSETYFEHILRNDIEIAIKYLAICKYENESVFYLFGCDNEFNSHTDYLFEEIEDAFEDAKGIYKTENFNWIKIGNITE
jgi:hypothetical protein